MCNEKDMYFYQRGENVGRLNFRSPLVSYELVSRLRAVLIFLMDSKAGEPCDQEKQFSHSLARFASFTVPKKNKELFVV